MKEIEIWKDLKSAPHKYKVSNKGRVMSKKRHYTVTHWNGYKEITAQRVVYPQIIKPIDNGKGYMRVNLTIDGKQKTKYIHHLMAEHFLPNPNDKPQVNHKNGIKDDNRLENLEWVTQSENMQHGYDIGLFSTGYDHPLRKLTKSDVKEIREMIDEGHVTQTEIAEMYGVCKQTITNVKYRTHYK